MDAKKKLKIWSAVGVFAVILLAAGWHFLYSDVVRNGLTAVLAPVNESPWEHAKLFFMPAIIWYVILCFIAGREFPNFVFSHALALVIMPAFMLAAYYIYSQFLKETIVLDIVNSFVTAALGQFAAYRLTTSGLRLSDAGYRTAAMAIVLVMLALFIVFTFYPPHCDMFFDSAHMKYGI
jgi:hypothetical protein